MIALTIVVLSVAVGFLAVSMGFMIYAVKVSSEEAKNRKRREQERQKAD